MKKKLLAVMLIVVVCTGALIKYMSELKTITFFSMDTMMKVSLVGSNANLEFVKDETQKLDKIFNAYDKNSEIYELNALGKKKVSKDMVQILNKSVELSEETNGSFDITLKNLKDLWDINSENPRVPDDKKIKDALSKSGMENLEINDDNVTLKHGIQLDFGAVAKGYLTDVVANALKDRGVKKFLLDFGGNIYAYSTNKPLKIGIQNPYSTRGDTVCVLQVDDAAVVSSGVYERNFEIDGKVYHHILDPKNGYPAQSGISQVTIIGKDATMCDAYSTAIAVSGLELAKELKQKNNEFEYIVVSENTIYVSENILEKIIQIQDGFKVIKM